LKKAVLRLAVEKYKKSVGPKGMTPNERDAFKAQLYTYLAEQLKITIEQAVDAQSESLPDDIVLSKENHKHDREILVEKSFKETEDEKYRRLAKEFNIVRDVKNEEKMI
jgi:hypothetical protein